MLPRFKRGAYGDYRILSDQNRSKLEVLSSIPVPGLGKKRGRPGCEPPEVPPARRKRWAGRLRCRIAGGAESARCGGRATGIFDPVPFATFRRLDSC
jgi:hypothetical protein